MTEVIEGVDVQIVLEEKVPCPFCPNKNLDDCKSKKQDPVKEVVSKPSQLGCTPLTQKGEFSYTTAKHHLISAKQCYAKIDRLVQMGSMAKYDINDPPNGISLPTVANNLRYTVGDKQNVKYGKLSDKEKKTVAFGVMEAEKAQWHVGHHAVSIEIPEQWAQEEEGRDWSVGHLVQYDNEVIGKLYDLLENYKPESECDETKVDGFKQDMDDLSASIKDKLNKFSTGRPSESTPFFVSQLAADFAKYKDDIPPLNQKKSRQKKK